MPKQAKLGQAISKWAWNCPITSALGISPCLNQNSTIALGTGNVYIK